MNDCFLKRRLLAVFSGYNVVVVVVVVAGVCGNGCAAASIAITQTSFEITDNFLNLRQGSSCRKKFFI